MKQSLFDIRCEWGEQGIVNLRDACDVIIVVDILSFSTCTSLAADRGAIVYPTTIDPQKAIDYADELQAQCASKRGESNETDTISLSPASFLDMSLGQRIVLPSPNGATLSLMGGDTPILSGSLRNARATATAAMQLGATIGIVPAGERWQDNSLRPAWEDLIGAGAIINELDGHRSPEAAVAEMAYLSVTGELEERMASAVSGRALIELGYEQDVALACEENADAYAARLVNGAFVQF
ncbi:2-phosphosulfolactate phosphatase [Reinekea sp.]|jgi:2-phosphosulfolactate phosphatase|uniref:2-phosphosulfolactate phosphatase n=1 Tax=Reinekea sp. TaxID=1970455 RepID=UPI003989B2F4